jgi:superfamily II DNA/RNA helicase
MQVHASAGDTDGAEGSAQANGGTHLAVSQTIKQVVRVCGDDKKVDNLVELLKSILRRPDEIDKRQPSAVLVFCTRIKTVRRVHKHLEGLGVRSGQLHGQLAQPLREKALADFKAGAVSRRYHCYTVARTHNTAH